jgi:hypothetical protein
MPASSPHDARHSEGEVRAAVLRLSRPCGDDGAVIERAAILAEGTPSAAIEAWVIDHGGLPEAAPPDAPAPGLFGVRSVTGGTSAPRRYVMPAAALRSCRTSP